MKTIKINILRRDADEELARITSYAGIKSPGSEGLKDLDRIATVDEDSALLNRYWQAAANTLADRLKDFITGLAADNESVGLTLEVSGAYDDALTPSLEGDLRGYAAAYMTRAWFAITLPERAAEWDAECERLLRDASRKLYHRKRPVRITHADPGETATTTD